MASNMGPYDVELVTDTFRDRYLDMHRLKEYLDIKFGVNNYKLQAVRDKSVLCWGPRRLSAKEIEEVHVRMAYTRYKDENDVLEELQNAGAKISTKDDQGQLSSTDASLKVDKIPGGSSHDDARSQSEGESSRILNSIPSHQLSDDTGIWFHIIAPDLGSTIMGMSFQSEENGRSTKGIYSVEVDSGESSKIFNVSGELKFNVVGNDQPVVRKFAIKQLNKSTNPEDFLREYKALKSAQSLDHPNIVELLSVFKAESGGEQHFNFAFPLALGNMKRLFLGEYDQIAALTSQTSLLWPQMVGLASAMAFLHESAHTAHRDIKPSNILIYQDNAAGSLILKLTDFGLAVNLKEALTWQEGSAAALSVLNDAPEIRLAFTKRQDNKLAELPSPKQLLSNDIWKLGCVFTELVTFLVGGSAGVTEFRDAITTETANILTDSFNDVRFDDGEKVKPEVMDYIKALRPKSQEVSRIESIICAMLDDSSARPSARAVCQLLINARLFKYQYPLDDGVRRVRLRPEESTPGVLDQLRLKIEKIFANPIDWSPMPPIVHPLREGEVKVFWQNGRRELSVVLSEDEGQRYVATCLARFENGALMIPPSKSRNENAHQTLTSSVVNHETQPPAVPIPKRQDPGPEESKLSGQSTPSSNARNPPVEAKEIYWCMDEVFTEPKETLLRPVEANQGTTDEAFYMLTNRALYKARGGPLKGWLFNRLSWKRCVGIGFRQFHMIKNGKDQVLLGNFELPPHTQVEYEHGMQSPEDVHMKIAAVQITAGLMDPEAGRGEYYMITMLPKKKVPPIFKKEMGICGWGIHAQMGFSVKKILWWLIFCIISVLVFAAVWLACINSTDLQNASVPATIVLTLFTIVLGVAQNLG